MAEPLSLATTNVHCPCTREAASAFAHVFLFYTRIPLQRVWAGKGGEMLSCGEGVAGRLSSSQTPSVGSQILNPHGAHTTLSRPRAVDLHNVFGYIDKLVDQTLSIHLGQDATLVVVPERPSHGFVVHVGLVFVQAP